MPKASKKLLIEMNEQFHEEIKMVALKNKKTMKQIVIEALVQYMVNIKREIHEKR